jgi:hypothetical protein
MNYELAKELKDKGFPNSNDWKKGRVIGVGVCMIRDDGEDFDYVPTLSELIEACGECLSHIKRYPLEDCVYWWAVSHCGHKEHEIGGNNLEEQGKTPEEAVARLWLALNKKNMIKLQ